MKELNLPQSDSTISLLRNMINADEELENYRANCTANFLFLSYYLNMSWEEYYSFPISYRKWTINLVDKRLKEL